MLSSTSKPNISSKRGTRKGGINNYINIIVFGSILFAGIFLISFSLVSNGLNAATSTKSSSKGSSLSNSNSVEDKVSNNGNHNDNDNNNKGVAEAELGVKNSSNIKNIETLKNHLRQPGGVTTTTIKNDMQQQQQQESAAEEYLLINMEKFGTIKIRFLPNLSPESVDHVKSLLINADGPCDKCKFYRTSKKLLLQGIMKHKSIKTKPTKGECPPEYDQNQKKCHGPTMTKGMVGWAGGDVGPDFFINIRNKPVDWWGQEHTVWGIVEDLQSLEIIEKTIIEQQPVHRGTNMDFLDEEIYFTMSLSTSTTKAT